MPDDCWQCHGTGVMRARGNCDHCLGWGWSIGPRPCERCEATGWIDADVALYWCRGCMRTVAAPTAAPACATDGGHELTRVSAPERAVAPSS